MMLDKKVVDFIEILSSKEPVPGGGGASATVGAFATALGMMVTNLTIGKKKYILVEDEMIEIRKKLEFIRDELIQLTDLDAIAFEPLAKAYSLPKNTEEEKQEKEKVLEKALYEASVVPIKIMETILEGMKLLDILSTKGSKLAISDVGVGILFAEASLEGASLNVFINTKSMKNKECAKKLNNQAISLINEGRALKEKIYESVLAQIQ